MSRNIREATTALVKVLFVVGRVIELRTEVTLNGSFLVSLAARSSS